MKSKMERNDNNCDIPTNLPKNFEWDVIDSYFKKEHLKQLVRHQLESYNDFVDRQIPDTINMFNPVNIQSEHDYDKDSKQYSLQISINFSDFGICLSTKSLSDSS